MGLESPISVIYDSNGNEVSLTASMPIPGTQPGLMLMASASNGTAQFFKLATTGELFITGSVTTTVSPVATQSVLIGQWATGVTASVFVSNQPTVNQGSPGSMANSWNVQITDGLRALGTGSATPLWVTGSVTTNITPVATQSVLVGQWATGVTASVAVGNWATNVTATINQVGAASSTVSSCLAAAVTGLTIFSANSLRRGATLFLDGNRIAYVKLGSGATSSDFSFRLTNNGYWELPSVYTGQVTVAFNAGGAVATLYTTSITNI